jgi:hypothetical protein
MGLGFVLVFWAVVGCMLAAGAGAVLAGISSRFTRGVATGRRRLLVTAALLPFACLLWAGIVFAFEAVVNEHVLHRDVGLGDSWHVPLPNGYQIGFIDVTDQGFVYNPKTQLSDSSIGNGPDTVFGVRTLQVAGPYLLGGADSKYTEHFAQTTEAVDSYFLLDTRNGKQMKVADLKALTAYAAPLGIAVHLEPAYSVYSHYRFTWFDFFAGLLLALPSLAALSGLGYYIARLRRMQPPMTTA